MAAAAATPGPAPASGSPVVRRLRAVPWRGRDALVVFLLPWLVVPIVLVLILQLIAPNLPGVQSYLHALNQNNPGASLSQTLVTAATAVLIIGYYLRKYGAGLRDLGLRRFNVWRVLLYLVIILLVFGFLVEGAYLVIQALDPSFNATQAQTTGFPTGQFSLLTLLGVVVIPPLIEESVFRGFMFPAFSKRHGVIFGAVITSVLFGFAHLQGNISVYTFVLSLLLCGLYVRTNSIIPGMAVHMLNNYVAYMGMLHK